VEGCVELAVRSALECCRLAVDVADRPGALAGVGGRVDGTVRVDDG
jgi:hypothetical protein